MLLLPLKRCLSGEGANTTLSHVHIFIFITASWAVQSSVGLWRTCFKHQVTLLGMTKHWRSRGKGHSHTHTLFTCIDAVRSVSIYLLVSWTTTFVTSSKVQPPERSTTDQNCISIPSIMLQLLRSHLPLSAVLPSVRSSLLRGYLTNSISSHRNVVAVQQGHLQMTLQQKTHLRRQYSTKTTDFVQHDSNGNVIIIILFYF